MNHSPTAQIKEGDKDMTNEMIILMESVKLMEDGKIKGTGEFITVTDKDGEKKDLELPEAIHTFRTWKKLGFSVKKGEKAVAQFPVWKYVKGKKDEETGEETKPKMYLKKASFFTVDQVQRIGE